jgi:hypothetical protein
MCELIPSIDLQLKTSCEQVVQSMGLVALLSLGLMMMGTWYQWELAHVEKKAIKHKRRWDAAVLGDATEVLLAWRAMRVSLQGSGVIACCWSITTSCC